MAYQRKTLTKAAPATAGKLLFAAYGYLVYWRFTTKNPPRPRRWVAICVFLTDPSHSKRSYYLTWNGERIASSEARDKLAERHPDIAAELPGKLAPYRARLVKPNREVSCE